MNVTLKDFYPVNSWKVDENGARYSCCADHDSQAMFLIDQTTQRRYLNESKGVVRFKCFLLSLGTPFVHSIASLANVAYRVAKLISLSHFWMPNKAQKYNFNARLLDAGKDLLRVVAQPLSFVALELASLYGGFRPYDGRKLYATIERATYGSFVLAPCFQPEPTSHAFGGDLNKRNAF